MRAAGILLPVFSLPGEYGIGCFSKEAYDFIDFLKRAGQTYWQILPLGPTSYGDSPYQSFSTFAGNPYFIDLKSLIEQGLLDEKKVRKADLGHMESRIDYAKQYENRFPLLREAFKNFSVNTGDRKNLEKFRKKNEDWVEDYALFMAVKNHFDDVSFTLWPEDIRLRDADAIARYKNLLQEDVSFYIWLQYEFYREWSALKNYAHKQGIRIIGDLPIYVSPDSADVWANPELFRLDEKRRPTGVAGCPPDGFAPEGQLWGNPLYDWDYHEKTGFAWWKKRIAMAATLYDVIRIDHFRGLDEYYAIPADAKNAVDGKWETGPGMKLVRALKPVLKKASAEIIAEDLGFITDTVRKLVSDSGYPNMKVLEFAFDARDTGSASDYMPYNYPHNCVSYTGTHDNETLLGWFLGLDKATAKYVTDFADAHSTNPENICKSLIRACIASPADTCIIPLQDYMGLDNTARINTPSTLGGNWVWRLRKDRMKKGLASEIRKVTKIYGR